MAYGQDLTPQRTTTDRVMAAIGGLGAGLQGQGAQYLEQQGRQSDRRRIIGQERKDAMVQDMFQAQNLAKSGNIGGTVGLLTERAGLIEQMGGDPSDTIAGIELLKAGKTQEFLDGTSEFLAAASTARDSKGKPRYDFLAPPKKTAAQRERSDLMSDLEGAVDEKTGRLKPVEDMTMRQQAAAIEAGFLPRAVGSAAQTIASAGTAEEVGDVKAIIKQREKFAEMTGSSRAKAIDSGFEKIDKINAGIRNIDRAVTALEKGAGVGAIESMLPSIRAASKELDNIRGSMALDVVGATTFGALSEGELNLAKDVALPTGLDTPELITYLQERKAAQDKLRSYYMEQIQHLDQGGTVASFLRQKEREMDNAPPEVSGQADQQEEASGFENLSNEQLMQMLQQAQ